MNKGNSWCRREMCDEMWEAREKEKRMGVNKGIEV